MTSQRKPHSKKAERLTTEEAMRRLFPKKVRDVAKEVAEAESEKKSTIKKDGT